MIFPHLERTSLSSPDLEQSVLALVNLPEYRPVKPRVIAKQLRLAEDEIDALKRVIKRLIKSGKLVWGPKHLVHAVEHASHHPGPLPMGEGGKPLKPKAKS